MIFVYIIIWILVITSHTSAQNRSSTDSSIGKTSPLMRRQWPKLEFEDFYQNSGDGSYEENITDSFTWIIIVTQVKASIWPTITRIKFSTPSPKPSRVSPTQIFSSDLFSWGSSYGYAFNSNSLNYPEIILQRSSFIYSGPSSSIEFSDRKSSSYIISISQLESHLNTDEIAMSLQPFTKSVTHSDRLTEKFSTDIYSSLLSSFEIKSDTHSVPRIESSFVITESELNRPIETTPFGSIKFTTVSDKNSIYTPLSLSRSYPENILSTPTPFISSIKTSVSFIRIISSSLLLDSTFVQITASQTVDTLLTSKSAPIITSTPIPTPLCPESLETELPKAYTLEKPFEDYLIRTVLNNTSNESIANIKKSIEGNIRQIYIYAFGKQYEEIDQKKGNGRKLLSKDINTTIDVKLWDISVKNGSQQIHVIYYVERDGTLIPFEDALRTLSYITNDKYSQMIGLDVIEKVKPYNEKLVAKSEMNWLGIILISCSGLLLIICIIAGLVVFCKYRTEKRKWIDAFHMELNRVVPDNQIHWRTVSHHIEPKSTGVKDTEFQYVPFHTDNKKTEPNKKIMASKGIQSNLEMQKEKVIPIAKIIDDSIDTIETTRTTFVTTKDFETGEDSSDTIPKIISVQMSEQTQHIIRAIRNELNKIGKNSLSFHGSQPEGSIISNSSEA